MNLNEFLVQFDGNAESIALSLTTALAQMEQNHPGIAEKYGWVQLADTSALARAIVSASQATRPEGLL